MDISPYQPLYTLVSDFSDHEVRLPRQVEIAQTADPLSIIRAVDTDNWKNSPLRTPEASTDLKLNVPDGKTNK